MFYSRCSTVNTAALENGVKAVVKGVIYNQEKNVYWGLDNQRRYWGGRLHITHWWQMV